DTGALLHVSRGGGVQPVWSPGGKELLFRGSNGRVMAVSYESTGSSFTFDTPPGGSSKRGAKRIINRGGDVAADGQRIAALVPADTATGQARNHIVYLDHFFDELDRLAPVTTQ